MKGRSVVGPATDDETAEVVVLEVVQSLLNGVVEIAGCVVEGDVKVERVESGGLHKR